MLVGNTTHTNNALVVCIVESDRTCFNLCLITLLTIYTVCKLVTSYGDTREVHCVVRVTIHSDNTQVCRVRDRCRSHIAHQTRNVIKTCVSLTLDGQVYLVTKAREGLCRGCLTNQSCTIVRTRNWRRAIYQDSTLCRAVAHYGILVLDKTSKRTDCSIRCLLNIYIEQVQALNRSCSCAEERCVQTLDGIAITVEGVCKALDWSPSLLCEVDVANNNCIGSSSCKSLQRCYVLDNVDAGISCVVDCIFELTNATRYQWLRAVTLDGCIHHATSIVVQCNVELAILAGRNCYVEIGRSARECYALAKRVADNALRRICRGNFSGCEVDCEGTCDRGTANIRNLCVSQSCRACNANLQHACEVMKLCRCTALAVAVHCCYATCEGCVVGVGLLRCEEYLTLSCSRVGDAIRSIECRRDGEARCCSLLAYGDRVRLDSVYRNLVASAPVEWIALTRLLAELSTRLLQREGNLGYALANLYAEILSNVGGTRNGYQRCYCKENLCQIFH